MKHERYVGFEIKALSNLLRRRLWGSTDHPHGVLTEIPRDPAAPENGRQAFVEQEDEEEGQEEEQAEE